MASPNHRIVFGNTSPNLINQSTNSIFNGKKLKSPDFKVVDSDWTSLPPPSATATESTLSSANFQKLSLRHNSHSGSSQSGSKSRSRSHSRRNSRSSLNFLFGSIDKDKSVGKDTRSELLTLPHNRHRSHNDIFETRSNGNTSPKRLRRSNTSELLDRFIPSRHTTSGKMSLGDVDLKSCALPIDHLACQTSKIYQNTVAEACGLEVGERILQFQPCMPEREVSCTTATGTTTTSGVNMSTSASNSTTNAFGGMLSASAVQSRLKKMPTCPQKVLDAPCFVDDFYLNLIDWSNSNVLAIALSNSVYCWNAETGDIDQLTESSCPICSVRWSEDGYYLSVGLEDGSIEIWDVETSEKLRSMLGHDSRVSSACWNQHLLTTGSRSGQLFHHDVRIQQHQVADLVGHTAEVCGVEWRSDGLQLASGGNDNVVNIWDARASTPQFTKTAHTAAVKALAWCPSHTSLLATGGGSACKKIHFWNTATGARVNTIDTESQVSSLRWGYSNGIGMEIAATHGFPNNDISVYAYPALQKTGVVIDAHESRVLASCLSPDGTTLATVAGDENLKFWKLFDYVINKDDELTGKGMNKVIR
ncbi:hypothetical protein FOA43_002109 [Brettanomyces nanus]|uniref:CDC20/Fizzy WD40 domain-containing protein n=1 Tax=Eeniella nana TaxID=13502 RepID=A0A875S337_EENNA|nr:uncharacterized protein FOA43_002109 [Brettanomyces nanus]QPG74775.1 hypothetical protein FOA43_002109 [Brettanomyces nanus]